MTATRRVSLPFRHTLRRMVRLALPVVAIQLGWMTLGVVDTIVVGHVSADAMAAVALGNLWFLAVSIFGMGVLMGLDPIVAQAVGAGEEAAVARALQRGLLLVGLLTVLCSVALLPAEPLFAILRQPPEILPTAAAYVRIAVGGVLPFLLVVLIRSVMQATSEVAPMVWATLAANLLNLALNWVLVFGHFGVPALGAIGSSWATTLSRWALAVFMIVFAWPRLRHRLLPLRREALAVAPLVRVLALGAPIGLQYEVELGIFSLVGIMMGQLGAAPMAANQVALNLVSLTFMVPLGVSMAAAVLVGQAVGRGDAAEARRTGAAALICGVGFMAASGMLMLAFPRFLARVYTIDPSVAAIAVTLIPVAGAFQVFDGTQVVSIGILRGTGDTRTPLLVHVLGYWAIALPLAAWLGMHTAAGPAGMWWGLVAGLAAMAGALVVRVRRRLRGPLQRVVVDHPAGEETAGSIT
ncbi:MAG TPA: MATE family efflux transporter [Gemmatimonadales bacterium]|nr:MATE family efflux transporter [Gemmatimonadales bacterium]